jgi:RNA polymerase sigma factor (sigma-70 family)
MMAKVASLPRIARPAAASRKEVGSAQRAGDEIIDGLIDQVLAGETEAWRQLAARTHPIVLAILCRRRLGGDLREREDLHRDVALAVLDRLYADGFAALRRYAGSRVVYPDTGFVQWLAVVVGNTFVDHLRALPEYQRRRISAARTLVRIEHQSLDNAANLDGGTIDPAAGAELRRILACFLADDFPAEQRRALLLWLDGNTPAEIAEELGLSTPQGASRLLHAARERLRRRFARD